MANTTAPEWGKSAARDYLYDLVLDGTIPGKDEIKPKEVFNIYCKHREEFKYFQDYKALDFAGKLRSARERAGKKTDQSKEDEAFLAHDRLIFPKPTVDTHGYPMWKGSKAQEILREMIAAGRHKKDKPKVLYESEEEFYENYSLDFFRDRIYQEVKFDKRAEYVKYKAEKAAEKAAEKLAKESQNK
jgi:hypothetical protein